ncbi:hypothetical protein FOMPIDRAFT_1024108 [Fomitopsis schrenkii]|uniref:Uncharacterized protein n=1 Tax=Fomitopsis schrenkii TaxID=2126942 RepID=S8E391_FOMSC|nr:hypothetical protein FOMPIDRAFT_1024108 [Fomitopsis schrenkii]
MPATTLAPAFSMSELLEGVPGLIEDWTSPFYGPFDDGNTSAFSSPSSSSSAWSSPSSSPSAASSAPSTPPQQHFAPGLLSSPVFPSCAPASGFALPSSPVHFQMDANPFAIPDLGYPGEPMYSGDSMYPANSMYPQDALALSQMDGMGALMVMQGNGEEQGQEGMSILNTYFNGVGGYMG